MQKSKRSFTETAATCLFSNMRNCLLNAYDAVAQIRIIRFFFSGDQLGNVVAVAVEARDDVSNFTFKRFLWRGHVLLSLVSRLCRDELPGA